MEFRLLLLTALSISEWQGAYASSDKASQSICEAYEEARRADSKLDNITTTATPSESWSELEMRPHIPLHIEGATQALRSNRKVMLEAVKHHGNALELASPELTADRSIVLEAVKQNGKALASASPQLKGDRLIVLEAVKQDGDALQWAFPELQADRSIVLAAVRQAGYALHSASSELKADKQVVLEAVKQTGFALSYASEELQNDREVVLEAVKRHGSVLEDVSEELKADREVVLEAVKQYGAALSMASEEFKADEEVVLAAMHSDWWMNEVLHWVSTELKADRQFMLKAIQRSGNALEHASEELQSDRQLVLEAVRHFGSFDALRWASADLRADREVVLEAVKQQWQGGRALEFASEELQADREILLEAVKTFGGALRYAPEELKNDRAIVLEAVKQYGESLEYASAELKADRQIVLGALENDDGFAFQHASKELRKDRECVLKAVKMDTDVLRSAIEFLDDREIMLEAVKHHSGFALRWVSDRLKADRQIVLEALKHDSFALEYVSEDLIEDQELMSEAIKLNPKIIVEVQYQRRHTKLKYLMSREARSLAINVVNTSWQCMAVTSSQANFSLLHDQEIVLALAKNEVCYLPYPVLPEKYRCDPEIADLAMKKDGLFLEDACEDLRANRSLVITAVEQNADALHNASQVLQGDWELVALAAAQGKARQFCKDDVQLHGERAHALRALQIDGMLLQCASPEFKADKELVSVAVKQSGCALMFSNQQWQSDPDFVAQVVAHNGLALIYASKHIQCHSVMQKEALRGPGWDWLLSKILKNDTADHAHLNGQKPLPKECINVGAEDVMAPNNTATFVTGGQTGLACLYALWPVLSDGPLACGARPLSSSSMSTVLILVCVLVGCFLLITSAIVAMKRRTIVAGLTQLWSKADHNQFHGVDLEGLISRPSGASNRENDEQHLENSKPP